MSRAATKILVATAMFAACLMTAAPKGWADDRISVDAISSTPTPSFDSDRCTRGSRWIDFSAGVGPTPWSGVEGAWVDCTARSHEPMTHKLQVIVGCSDGSARGSSLVTYGTTFFPFNDLDVLCPSGTTARSGVAYGFPDL